MTLTLRFKNGEGHIIRYVVSMHYDHNLLTIYYQVDNQHTSVWSGSINQIDSYQIDSDHPVIVKED